MSLADKLMKKSRIQKTTVRGERVGIRILTINELRDHSEAMKAAAGDLHGMYEVFASYLVNDDGTQAFTVDEMEEVLTNNELVGLMEEFNKLNGLVSDASAEKN